MAAAIGLTAPSEAREIRDVRVQTDATPAAKELYNEAGNISLNDMAVVPNLRMITFDDQKAFSTDPKATTLPTVIVTDPGPEQIIQFNAPNANWWQVLADNKWMYHSASQSLSLRGLPMQPEELYLTFSQPVSHVGFVMCNMVSPEGTTVLFYGDKEGTDIVQEVKVEGGEKHVEANGTKRGSKTFVGVHAPDGIRRIGFSFEGANESELYMRGLDDLVWVPVSTD